jgi:hypothetical protein
MIKVLSEKPARMPASALVPFGPAPAIFLFLQEGFD